MTASKRLTLGWSSHHVETLELAAAHMRRHEAILLEEPPEPTFAAVLAGARSIEAYVEETAPAFPTFVRRTCELARALHAEGHAVLQVEPFLAELAAIHDLFDAGGRPADIVASTRQGIVYAAERRWTGALVAYYERTARRDPFEAVVAAVQDFARVDAARGRLRDELRAAAITATLPAYTSAFVEAGYLHRTLSVELARRLPAGWSLATVHVMEPVVRRLAARRQLLGPGDRLTLGFMFRPDRRGPRVDLMAARSLVHTQLLARDERLPSDGVAYPHVHDDIASGQLVDGLSFDDCRTLFDRLRDLDTEAARTAVAAWRVRGR